MEDRLLDASVRGPLAVGVASIEIEDGQEPGRVIPVDIWYPAESSPEATGAEEAPHPYGRPHRARPDAPPVSGPCPLVLFSHGNAGLRRQSTFLTTQLASWGTVVAAPDHMGNTAFEMAPIRDRETLRQVHLDARRRRPLDLQAVLARVETGPRSWPAIDPARIAALGHSYGGWTALKMPRLEDRISAVCALAPTAEAFVGRRAFEPEELPFRDAKPVLIVAGLDDVRVDFDVTVRPLFDRMAEPRALVAIDECDHFHHCDGVELLHRLTENRPADERQSRARRPYDELLPEDRIHRALRGVVTRFFDSIFAGDADPFANLDAAALRAFDPALHRLDASEAPKTMLS